MKNRLVFRIIGALASALIIVSVFIPFISTTGFTQSLWEANKLINALYLPIMIIVFGSIGVLVFSTNIKTELAYATSGALLFYIITQIIPIIDEGQFSMLGVGFYCLAIGTILTGIMAFICNLRIKIKEKIEELKKEEVVVEQNSVLDQIDKLYNDQSFNNNDGIMMNNGINPLPMQPMSQDNTVQSFDSMQPFNIENNQNNNFNSNTVYNANMVAPMNNGMNPFPMQPMSQENIVQPLNSVQSLEQNNQNFNEVIQNNNSITNETAIQVEVMPQSLDQSVTSQQNEVPISQNNNEILNNQQNQIVTQDSALMQSVQAKEPVQSVSQEQNVLENSNGTSNPVIAEFGGTSNNPVTTEFGGAPLTSTLEETGGVPNNPVTAEFEQPSQQSGPSFIGISAAKEEKKIEPEETIDETIIEPLSEVKSSVDVMANQVTNKNSDLDIFG